MDSNASRARRGVAVPATATISRPVTTSDTGKRSIRLTVKAQPSKLREVTSGFNFSPPPAQRDGYSRSSKNKKPIIDASSDEDDENDSRKNYRNADNEEEEEETLEIVPPRRYSNVPEPPRVKISAPRSGYSTSTASARKLSPGRTLKLHSHLKSVEDKEMEDATPAGTDDEELSSVASDDGEEDENGEAEADEDDDEEEEEQENGEKAEQADSAEDSEDLDQMLLDQADDTLAGEVGNDEGMNTSEDENENDSNSGTPDISKLTRRQRAAHFGEDPASPSGLGSFEGGLMSLSNDPQKKKFFTAEQLTMRRAEMARRRKDLSEKRLEEEKTDTLQKLLYKPSAPKRRSKAQIMADAEREDLNGTGSGEGEDGEPRRKANPLYVRTVISGKGTRVGVPREWLGTPAGKLFDGASKSIGDYGSMQGRLVVEVTD